MIDLALVIQFVQQRSDDADPGAVLTPTVEAREDRLPGAVAFRKITPRGAGMQNPEDAVEDRTRIVERVACLIVMGTVWQ